MKRILFSALVLICFMTVFAQDSMNVDSLTRDTVRQSHSKMTTGIQQSVSKALADSAYIQNDFASAIHLYESLLKNTESADIYYNLGNSYYKADNIAEAILNYERALLLDPGDNDIRFNLEMARSKTVDKVNAVSEMFFMTWIKALVNYMGADAWAKWGIISFIILLMLILSFLFTKQILIKKISFNVGIFFFISTVSANIFAAQQKYKLIYRNNAIITVPSVTVKSTPNESGTDLFILHEGRKVEMIDNSMKEWKEIKLEDGNIGWIPVNTMKII